ncbi:hypothetical protein [Rhizobium sp. PP-CC-3G-465]|uniref:hypothetical protein n=1 Tax=Rhizobium sp. PP-CC-3G-465 TaxID=2135648 RepID=UPI001051BE11|nr:hypothetical protein C8J33_1165 [Rhizobium sp. PP-CC-3G-465]
MNDDVKKELQSRVIKAQADVDVKRQETIIAAKNVYANPRNALSSMMDYSRKHGDGALVTKLEQDPNHFGAMKGHFGSGDALSLQGMRDKKLSKEIVLQLPGLVKETLEADNKLLALERSLADSGRSSGLARGKDGIDFS